MKDNRPPVWTRSFTALVGANSVYFFGFYMLTPTLPLYVAQLGGSDTQVGAVAAAFSAASILIRMAAGWLLSRLGRSAALRMAMVISAGATAGYCLVEPYVGILMLRVLQGIAFGLVSTVCSALAADLLPDSRRGEGISFLGLGTTTAIALSPTLGLWCMEHAGFHPMFITAAVSILAALLLFLVFQPEKGTEPAAREQREKTSLLKSLYEPSNTFPYILMLLFGVCRGAESNFLSLLAGAYAIAGLSYYYIIQTSVSFVMKLLVGRVYDIYGHKASVIPGGLAGLACMLLLAYARTTPVLLTAGVCSGIAVGAIVPAIQTWTVSSVPSERRVVASASYYNLYDLGMGGGAILLGRVAAAANYSVLYQTASLFMVAFLALYIGYLVKKRA